MRVRMALGKIYPGFGRLMDHPRPAVRDRRGRAEQRKVRIMRLTIGVPGGNRTLLPERLRQTGDRRGRGGDASYTSHVKTMDSLSVRKSQKARNAAEQVPGLLEKYAI